MRYTPWGMPKAGIQPSYAQREKFFNFSDFVLKFSIEGSQLLGHKLTLNRMRDGNMREAPLSANQF